MLTVAVDEDARADLTLGLDEICREGARRMLAAALEAEADAYVASVADEVDADGHRLVVRNGHARPRPVATGSGPIEIEAPRVNDKRIDEATGKRCRFRSSIIPPWARKSPKVAEVLPLMYLQPMSSGDFAPALSEFFGSAAGLSASVVTRLTKTWQDERERFAARSLADRDYVYVWADGVHFNVRLDESRLCALVTRLSQFWGRVLLSPGPVGGASLGPSCGLWTRSVLLDEGPVQEEVGRCGSYLAHPGEDLLRPAVVADPLAVELCLLWGEPAVDCLAVDRLGEVPVGTV
jgi:hypothetical protein